MIRSGVSNFNIITTLENDDSVPSYAIPDEKKITNRRYYMKKVVLKALKGIWIHCLSA